MALEKLFKALQGGTPQNKVVLLVDEGKRI
jgi:hypothetical protein